MIVLDGVEMVDVREAARLARRTPETIRRWVWDSRLSSVKQGNRLLMPREELVAIAGSQTGEDAESRLTLGEWSAQVAAKRTGESGATASDLVRDDRARR